MTGVPPSPPRSGPFPSVPHPRIDGTGEDVGRSLGRLVVALLDAVRQVIERQALRRVDAGDLSDEEVERLGQALMELDTTFDQLADTFGVTPDDLYLPVDLEALLYEDSPRKGAPS